VPISVKGGAMKNNYIEIVKKWLANPDSVSLEEMQENLSAAHNHYISSTAECGNYPTDIDSGYSSYVAIAASLGAEAAEYYCSSDIDDVYAAHDCSHEAQFWIDRYEALNDE